MSNGKISNPRMFQNFMQAVLPCHLIIERIIKMKQYVLLLKDKSFGNKRAKKSTKNFKKFSTE